VDVVRDVEGGAGPKHQHRHMSTHNHQLLDNDRSRTMSRPNGERRSGCSDVSISAHTSSISDTSGDVPDVAAIRMDSDPELA
jgi:hypothetical protein